jgi:hypothetical protein
MMVIDEWCEQRMWKSIGIETNGVDPMCAVTGLAIAFIPILYPVPKPRLPLLFVQSGLYLLAIGTVVFHSVRNLQLYVPVNINSFDWFPILFVCASLLFMYILPILKFFDASSNQIIVLLFVTWSGFLFITADDLTSEGLIYLLGAYQNFYQLLQLIMILPLVLCLLLYSCNGYSKELYGVWGYSIVAMALFLVNTHYCEQWYGLAILHAIYHIIITRAIWIAAGVANKILYEQDEHVSL